MLAISSDVKCASKIQIMRLGKPTQVHDELFDGGAVIKEKWCMRLYLQQVFRLEVEQRNLWLFPTRFRLLEKLIFDPKLPKLQVSVSEFKGLGTNIEFSCGAFRNAFGATSTTVVIRQETQLSTLQQLMLPNLQLQTYLALSVLPNHRLRAGRQCLVRRVQALEGLAVNQMRRQPLQPTFSTPQSLEVWSVQRIRIRLEYLAIRILLVAHLQILCRLARDLAPAIFGQGSGSAFGVSASALDFGFGSGVPESTAPSAFAGFGSNTCGNTPGKNNMASNAQPAGRNATSKINLYGSGSYGDGVLNQTVKAIKVGSNRFFDIVSSAFLCCWCGLSETWMYHYTIISIASRRPLLWTAIWNSQDQGTLFNLSFSIEDESCEK